MKTAAGGNSATAEKRKQKRKKGRVVRLRPDLELLVEFLRLPDETVSDTVGRLIEEGSGEPAYVLPSDLFESIEDARGEAVLRAVKRRAKRTEKPLQVRVRSAP